MPKFKRQISIISLLRVCLLLVINFDFLLNLLTIMAATYSFGDQTDMLLVLGFCAGNCRQSVRVYQERFPTRQVPNHKTFARIE
ncbi:MAG TPA: hypothetical protein VJ279_07900, partial [Hanamia sp.]|nr:hypothetical protein [Hanamia sp.]